MAPKFGTSGLRGLVTELTDPLCAAYAEAFLGGAETDGTVLIGRDLRASSPRLAAAVAAGAARLGLKALDCGVLPTPALALAAEARGTAAIMVTGSHIPDDRNGLKFYTKAGEITKTDEAAINARVVEIGTEAATSPGKLAPWPGAAAAYAARYTGFYPADHLAGLRIGVYEHSSAARDLIAPIFEALGATCIGLGRSDHFIPVDTEAVDAETRDMLAGWAHDHGLDAIVSTDGDADRPMLTDASGRIVPGDRIGPIAAQSLGATDVVTPVSSNTLVDHLPGLAVTRTMIGSPYVIAGMEAAGDTRVVGYEPNGGFLLGFEAHRGAARLAPLLTRDCLLPILAALGAARAAGQPLADLVAALPARFTVADRLQGVATDASLALVDALRSGGAMRDRLFQGFGEIARIDETDGFRVIFADGRIGHIRPSGNAPECRVYAEAESPEAAAGMQAALMARAGDLLAV